jgi:DNA-binding NtrC family response regulator
MNVRNTRATILHFGSDRAALSLRSRNLKRSGYEVLNATDGFEALRCACLEVVDAVVLDQDGNSAEVEFVAAEIKRCRPQVPTIVLAKGAGPLRWTPQLADARVKTENVSLLFAAL